MRAPLTDRCRGRWSSILPLVGIDRTFLSGKHGPCPLCRDGRDRWRFINREGSGDWVCNACGHGSGMDLVLKFLKVDFKSAAKQIEEVIGASEPDKTTKPKRDERRDKARMKALWAKALPITPGTAPARYLNHTRALGIREFPPCLRFLASCPYDDFADGRHFPAILAKVISAENQAVNLHRIFITADGLKAPLDPARKLMPGALPPGAAVRLGSAGKVLGVSTGIETSFAAMRLFGVGVWAVLVDGGLERFVIPPGVEELIIFGDHDASYSGHKASYALAYRARVQAKIKATVEIPAESGHDWNDVLFHMERSAA